jgi:hypothetical protein
MKTRIAALLTMAALIALSSTIDAQSRRTNRSASTSMNKNGPVTDCGDIQVTYERRPAVTDETQMSLSPSQVSTLRAQLSKGGIYINGWDRNEYSVKTCKAAPDDADATSTLRDITTSTGGDGQLAVNGPADRDWMANLIIMTPRLSTMDIQTVNGPLQLRDLAGNIRLSATNGPVSLNNVGGVVSTTTTNGPISLAGASGDQRVTANNGPISIQLSGNRWDGPGLEVSTRNGPLSLSVPDAYGSGISIQSSDRSPLNCAASVCAGATRTAGSPSVIRIGSGEPVIRLSTSSGPLSIRGPKN